MYTTQPQVEARLGKQLTDEQAAYFNIVLDAAIDSYISRETGVLFGSTGEIDVYVDGTDTDMLIIPTMHNITAVTRIDDSGGEQVIPVDEYRTYPQGNPIKYGIRKLNGTWEEGFENYKVSGLIGYEEVPADIMLAATEMAVNSLQANENNYKSERVGDWSVTYKDAPQSLSADTLTALQNYRRLSRSI